MSLLDEFSRLNLSANALKEIDNEKIDPRIQVNFIR